MSSDIDTAIYITQAELRIAELKNEAASKAYEAAVAWTTTGVSLIIGVGINLLLMIDAGREAYAFVVPGLVAAFAVGFTVQKVRELRRLNKEPIARPATPAVPAPRTPRPGA